MGIRPMDLKGELKMSLQTVERAILAEAKVVTGKPKLKMKDIMEWTTGEIEPQLGEKLYFLPELQINIAIKEN